MKEVRYALIVRDERDKQIAVVGTHREPATKHDKVAPGFHAFCLSVFALHPMAATIETVSWQAGTDLDRAPVLVAAKKTEQVGVLNYRFPSGTEVQA